MLWACDEDVHRFALRVAVGSGVLIDTHPKGWHIGIAVTRTNRDHILPLIERREHGPDQN